jgi:hypothetical protein
MMIESWRDFEVEYGEPETVANVRQNMPKRIIRRRPMKAPDGVCFTLVCVSVEVRM